MAQLICKMACRVDGSSGHEVIWAGLAVRNVKVLMTTINCQPLLYELLFACSFAPCGAPALRVAIQASTTLKLLRRKRASAGLTGPRRGDVRHALTSDHFRALSSCHVIIESCRNEAHENKRSPETAPAEFRRCRGCCVGLRGRGAEPVQGGSAGRVEALDVGVEMAAGVRTSFLAGMSSSGVICRKHAIQGQRMIQARPGTKI
jgi:hypothetical protein